MREYVEWLRSYNAPPALAATVAHAWLTHLHPFEDGNGRVARLMANVILGFHKWPPLIIKSGSDRGQYLDALSYSDDGGDILPLFELFVDGIQRSAKDLADPDRARELMQRDIHSMEDTRYAWWHRLLGQFGAALTRALAAWGMALEPVGEPESSRYALLCNLDKGGNGWYAKVRDHSMPDRPVLIWFGFASQQLRSQLGDVETEPSLFFSERDLSEQAIHPYRPLADTRRFAIDEVSLRPRDKERVVLRTSGSIWSYDVDEGAQLVANQLRRFLNANAAS